MVSVQKTATALIASHGVSANLITIQRHADDFIETRQPGNQNCATKPANLAYVMFRVQARWPANDRRMNVHGSTRKSRRANFQDARPRKRSGIVLERFWSGMGQTIPFACQDWASTKAVYRFLSNDRVSEQDILSGHFQASGLRDPGREHPRDLPASANRKSYYRIPGQVGRSLNFLNNLTGKRFSIFSVRATS
jgi:hypothetical protein